ncbi:hypothetical protein V6Z12_A07G222100 [Gossypium hirsutum]
MKQMMKDFGVDAINISMNLVQHLRTKHIDIKRHLIRELIENGAVELKFMSKQDELANLFTKPLDTTRFKHLRSSIGMFRV